MRYLQKVWKWLFGIIVVLIFLPAGRISSCWFSERNKRIDRQSRSGDSGRRRLTVELFPAYPTLRHYVKVL